MEVLEMTSKMWLPQHLLYTNVKQCVLRNDNAPSASLISESELREKETPRLPIPLRSAVLALLGYHYVVLKG